MEDVKSAVQFDSRSAESSLQHGVLQKWWHSPRVWKLLSLGLAVYIAIDYCVQGNNSMEFQDASSVGDREVAPKEPLWKEAGQAREIPPWPRELHNEAGRKLSSATSSSSEVEDASSATSSVDSASSGSCTASDGVCEIKCPMHHTEPHDAMFFLFNAILVGTLILHLTTLPKFHSLQQTVVLFILGTIYSLLQAALTPSGLPCASYWMWMAIDPHLLLFALLPALLTGDAMTIDTSVARAVAKQCLYLAGPGVIIQAFITSLALWAFLPYEEFSYNSERPGESFKLCFVTASILAATDPVAVVGLLKNLGASPTLTVQIQGESLLNDGTAIVLYMLAYKALAGDILDTGEVIIFLVKTAACAAGLGYIIGWVFVLWIRATSKRLESHAGLIQTALTLCCAYWSFIIAEGALHISGVLCTVTASLLLADKMWPAIVDKDSVLHVWHMFEYLGNTVIFFLAGALTGEIMVTIPLQDYFYLLCIYVFVVFIRFFFFQCSRPMLQWLSEDQGPVDFAEATIMAWGGLRGAVGLALAIQVKLDRASYETDAGDVAYKLSPLTGERVLFYVAGIASFTLCLNAPTCPWLVRSLHLISTPEAKKKMLFHIYDQLQRLSRERCHPEFVQKAIRDVLGEAKRRVEDSVKEKSKSNLSFFVKQDSSLKGKANRTQSTSSMVSAMRRISALTTREGKRGRLSARVSTVFTNDSSLRPGSQLAKRLEMARQQYDATVSQKDIELLAMPELPWKDQEETLKTLVTEGGEEESMVETMNDAFLSLVRAEYWELIEAGEFVSGTNDAELLLNSVAFAFKTTTELLDFKYLKHHLRMTHSDFRTSLKTYMHNIKTSTREEPSVTFPESLNEQEDQALQVDAPEKPSNSGDDHVAAMAPGENRSDSGSKGSNPSDHSVFGDLLAEHHVSMGSEESNNEQLRRAHPWKDFIENSLVFNVGVVVLIAFNAIFIGIEQSYRKETDTTGWFEIEVAFCVIFSAECIMKIVVFGWRYFCGPWNIFDFVLVTIGIVGLVIEVMASGNAQATEEARLLRINRVFRVLRVVRVFRLAKFAKILMARIAKKDIQLELAEYLQVVTVLRAFVNAHAQAQKKLLSFVGTTDGHMQVEEARAILESQIQVYMAIALAAEQGRKCDPETLKDMNTMRETTRAMLELSKFVINATKAGIINSREAECIVVPLQAKIQKAASSFYATKEGAVRKSNPRSKADAAAVHQKVDAAMESEASGHSSKDGKESGIDRESAIAKLNSRQSGARQGSKRSQSSCEGDKSDCAFSRVVPGNEASRNGKLPAGEPATLPGTLPDSGDLRVTEIKA